MMKMLLCEKMRLLDGEAASRGFWNYENDHGIKKTVNSPLGVLLLTTFDNILSLKNIL